VVKLVEVREKLREELQKMFESGRKRRETGLKTCEMPGDTKRRQQN
jgi:hypothetical protein